MNERIYLNNRRISIDALTAFSVVGGIVAGVIMSFGVEQNSLSAICSFESLILNGTSGKWMNIFFSSFLSNEIWLLAAFLFGFGAIYQPLSVILLIFRGLGLGACTRGIYLTADVLANLAVFLLPSLMSLSLLVMQTKQAMSLQTMYLSLTMTNENRLGLKREASDYISKFLIYSVFMCVVGIIECIIVRIVSA